MKVGSGAKARVLEDYMDNKDDVDWEDKLKRKNSKLSYSSIADLSFRARMHVGLKGEQCVAIINEFPSTVRPCHHPDLYRHTYLRKQFIPPTSHPPS